MEKGIPCNNKMQCYTFTFTGFSKKAIPRHSFMSLAPVCRKVFLKMSQQKVNIHLVHEHKHNPKLNLFDEQGCCLTQTKCGTKYLHRSGRASTHSLCSSFDPVRSKFSISPFPQRVCAWFERIFNKCFPIS